MAMLQDRFKSAASFMASPAAKKLSLPSSTKLAIYADYKLATEGLCTQSRPSLIEFEKTAKWKAWKETGERYLKELDSTPAEDFTELTIPLKAMISYVQRVEDGQWGWTFEPTAMEITSSTEPVSTGDQDLDELEAYLGIDKDEVSAEELLARPFVPIPGEIEGASMTASGISTMAFSTEDESGEDALEAAKQGSIEDLRSTIDANPALVSLKDDMGFTMLHWACDRGSLEKVKALVEDYHADVNAQDHEGSTPLHFAYLAGWPEVIAYLTSLSSVDQGIRDHSGMTAAECQD
ncbi:hypothetical protein EDD11_005303 [Mortierella claussenii]|nr:hypothetical protein EDD11_005303 [Mortierella claussenii]